MTSHDRHNASNRRKLDCFFFNSISIFRVAKTYKLAYQYLHITRFVWEKPVVNIVFPSQMASNAGSVSYHATPPVRGKPQIILMLQIEESK